MNPYQKQKKENIKNMFFTIGEIYKKMEQSPLKKELQRLVYFLLSKNSDFKKILESIDKKIQMYEKATNKIVGIDNKGVVVFWKNIKSIIMNTYNENKKLDRSL